MANKKRKNIHFVCVGNTFRSRLAEAYFNSLKIEDWKASSSGIDARKNFNGPICFYTREILNKNKLKTKKNWTQTTKKKLEKADLIIFLKKAYHDHCRRKFGLVSKKSVIWNIEDVKVSFKEKKRKQAQRIFQKIKNQVNQIKKI